MSKGYDPSRSSLDRLVKGSSRNIEITDNADQFLDVGVDVVPLFHHVRQIELASRSHDGIGEQNGQGEGTRKHVSVASDALGCLLMSSLRCEICLPRRNSENL